MEQYFKTIEKGVMECYDFANRAKSKGFDPEDQVDITLAKNVFERVEGLIATVAPQVKNCGISERFVELEKKYGAQDWRVAFTIALEVAQQKFCKFESVKEAIEVGLRVALAYLTNGVVSSPLEGFSRLEIKKRRDGKEYFALFFSGPIRSAGTTATCAFVSLCDYIRRKMGYSVYDPTHEEVERIVTEMYEYHERITNLQYLPTEEEIRYILKALPMQIDGDASEDLEVSQYKRLSRIATDRMRNGVCLVVGEGLAQKAAKFWSKFSKWNKDFEMEDWSFMQGFIELQNKVKAKGKAQDSSIKIKPDFTYIKDLVAGRPVFSHPLTNGGFRLRYGRSRASGFSSQAIHPATMAVLNNFLAVGSQLKVERPGKATVLAVCDTIEGPIVKLNNGNVMFLESEDDAKKIVKDIEEILYLGDLLINYGDFLDRGHLLVPVGYNEEWYALELEKAASGRESELVKQILGNRNKKISAKEAIHISETYNVPLHPRYTFHWGAINKLQLLSLIDLIAKSAVDEEKIVMPITFDIKKDVELGDPKRVLELLGVPHVVATNEYIVVNGDWAIALKASLENLKMDKEKVLEMLNPKLNIRDKCGTYIGARMGRPEKAKMRKLTGSPQALFPVGAEGGRLRCFQAALEAGSVTSQFQLMICPNCNEETIYRVCEVCNVRTKQMYYCKECDKISENKECHKGTLPYVSRKLDIQHYFNSALLKLGMNSYPELIKGVRGTSNETHIPEHLVKGILRAKHNLYVNKDGTIRYDMTETAITHFKPKEIGTSVEKLKELGYGLDVYGNTLENDGQILELKPQDVILPACPDSSDESAAEVLFRVGSFIDELLISLYGENPYYKLKDKSDLVGHLALGLSPHTTAGIVCRIIGFSKTQGFYAHPYLHSMMRRDADGDEACVVLLMDALLNFSKRYLPAHRGAKQDEPLVLTFRLVPAELDDMVFNMDIVFKYPLELYEAAMQYKPPGEVNILKVRDVLNTEKQYSGFGFTHDTKDINNGVLCSAYKSIPTMQEKVVGQMDLAGKIRAVDESDVARLVIERHFIRDIKGNLRRFFSQEFRCVKCNEKFRRPPLAGRCDCGGNIIFTVGEGSIVKYLEPSLSLARKYPLPPYLKQTLELAKSMVESVFGKTDEKQEGLVKWFG